MSAYTTLIELTKEALQGKGDLTPQRVDQYLPFMIRAVKSLNYNALNQVVTESFELDSKKQITLPQNYIDYVAIGYLHNGQFKPLGYNKNILTGLTVDNCGNPVYSGGTPCKQSSNIVGGLGWYNSLNWNVVGQYLGAQYGGDSSMDYRGYYAVAEQLGIVQFSSDINLTHVVMKYVSEQVVPNRSTQVHEMAREAVLTKAYHYSIRDRKTVPQAEKARAYRQSEIEESNFRTNRNPWRAEEFIQTLRSGWTQSPKT